MRKAFALVLLTMVFAAACTSARAADTAKDEMGLTTMKVVYPEPGVEVDNHAPMIAADFTGLENPVDPETVVILLDGINVTDSSDVTVNYALYKPPKDLSGGKHDVRITASDVSGARIQPLAWEFSIKTPPVPKSQKPDKTTGKLVATTDIAHADYTEDPLYKVPDILEEKDGAKFNMDFDFNNISDARTIVGAYHRETQLVTDKEIDKLRLNYFDDEIEASLGHFWVELSNLTIAGAEMGGVKVDHDRDDWTFSLFSGRTQDPSTSGTFKQVTTGARSSYHWGRRNTTSLTYLYAQERDDEFYSQLDSPADDRVTSLHHEYKFNNILNAEFEAAANTHQVQNMVAEHDSAYRFELTGNYKRVYGEAEAYSIGEFFFPVADGNRKYLNNNRDGYRGLGKLQVAKWLSTGGEYEQYDSDDTTTQTTDTTKRGNAFVAVAAGTTASLKYSYSKMTVTTGVLSERDQVTAYVRVRKAGDMHDGTLSVNWQDMDYENLPLLVNTQSLGISYRARFRKRFGWSMGYTGTDTDSIFQSVYTENEKYYFGIDWDVKPRRFSFSGKYEVSDTQGWNKLTGATTADQAEWRLKTMFKYNRTETYTWLLGYDLISYEDSVNTSFSYDQNIVRGGLEMKF